MKAHILSIATSTPPHILEQSEAAEFMVEMLSLKDSAAQKLRKLYQNSSILKRHSIIADFKKLRDDWSFWGNQFPQSPPTTSHRNNLYKLEAPKLASQAARLALKNWGGDPKQITHVIFVSCTGMLAPGIEFHLLKALNLNRSTSRLGINFMGCFGAFKGLAVAQAFAKENPEHRILLVCTELCSLHLQADLNMDTLVGNSLFADGSAAAIIGCSPTANETPLWEIVQNASHALEDSLDKMSWEACDTGYAMRLSNEVPALMCAHIHPFASTLLKGKCAIQECDWAIHPGGKAILQGIEKEMNLEKEQTIASWSTLANYGNMSSATFLFVLDALKNLNSSKKWSLGIGFGPGLSIEGILLRKHDAANELSL